MINLINFVVSVVLAVDDYIVTEAEGCADMGYDDYLRPGATAVEAVVRSPSAHLDVGLYITLRMALEAFAAECEAETAAEDSFPWDWAEPELTVR